MHLFIYVSGTNQGLVAEIKIHTHPVRCMALNIINKIVISADNMGVIEYWDVDTYDTPVGICI
jgi:hypothetical protein